METDCIHFKDTGYFSTIVVDYLANNEKLKPFYQHYFDLDSYKKNISERSFPTENRAILVDSLRQQYEKAGLKLNKFEKVKGNIEALASENTFTITTGHQLCLFTGPLYFIYKIVSAIKLSQNLAAKYPDQQFVPVYWMATEDHDFAEVNHFRFKGKKYEWSTEQEGAVGRMNLEGLQDIAETFSNDLTDYSSHSEQLIGLFKSAYLKHKNLADATRFLANELFAEYGVVVVDGDDKKLKNIFAPIVKKELLTEFSSHEVEKQNEQLSKHYKIQVNPREINLFYLVDGARNRIVKENEAYFINDTAKSFSEEEILKELSQFPERFSPNVLLRPVYQEAILPNLTYIGGGGELAYWFQLRSTFESVNIPMPALMLRNSVMWMNEKQSRAFKKLQISLYQIFLEEGVLMKEWTKQNSDSDLTLADEQKRDNAFFNELKERAKSIDSTLEAHVEAVQTKQLKALKNLSEKFIRARRRQESEAADRVHFIKSTLFPNGGLQERTANFSSIYSVEGKGMIKFLLDNFETPSQEFLVIY